MWDRILSCKTRMPWARSGWAMAVSCVALFVPAVGLRSPLLAAVAVTSTLSDTVYTGTDSVWHPIDRAVATVAFFAMLLRTWAAVGWGAAGLFAPLCICYSQSVTAIAERRARDYYIWHIAWHACSVCGCTLLVWLEADATAPPDGSTVVARVATE